MYIIIWLYLVYIQRWNIIYLGLVVYTKINIWYSRIILSNSKELQLVRSGKIDTNVWVDYYSGYDDNQYINICLIKEGMYAYKKISSESINLSNRNKIVYCSLLNKKEKIDIIELFRLFVYHFDKTDRNSKIINFIKYIKSSNKEIKKIVESPGTTIMIVLNDLEFTQVTYRLDELTDETFSSIFNDSIDTVSLD